MGRLGPSEIDALDAASRFALGLDRDGTPFAAKAIISQ